MVTKIKRDGIMRSGKIIVYICILLLLTGGFAAAQNGGPVWEGTASMSRYGEFPATGLYAASNSFPRNTIVEVENLQNGKTASVIIADRLNNPGLFMLLSREAAGALGITQDETVQVRVALESESESIAESLVEERPYSRDPDVNPAASAERYELPELEEEAQPEEAQPEVAVEEEPVEPEEAPEPEEPAEAPEVIEDETPRLATAIETPEIREARLPSLNLPAEPEEAEPVQTEEPAAEPAGEELPRVSVMAGSPDYKAFRLPDLALPAGPPEPGESEKDAAPERELPEMTALQTSPDIPGLTLSAVAVPEEPGEEAPEEPVFENGEISLASMSNPSPDVEPLELWDLDVPDEPGRKVVAEEDEVPSMSDVAGSPFVEELHAAALKEPLDPSELPGETEIAEAAEEKEPEDSVPELSELLITPEARTLALDSVDEPEEPAEEEREAPEVAALEGETPERRPEVELASIDEPAEPAEEETMVAEIVDGDLSVEIPEDSMLVMEPAEPKPPEDTSPAAVEVPGTEITEPEEAAAVDEPQLYPEPPEEEGAGPLIAEAEAEEAAAEVAVTAGSLERGAYYVQLGVYSESKNAKQIADKYSVSYPVAVLRESSASKQIYKVLLGPVNLDESGGLLYNFRAKGFKDAFIRKE